MDEVLAMAKRLGAPTLLCNATQLFANEPPQGALKGRLLNVTLQGLIDKALIVATACLVYLCLEPIDYIGIKANGDARLPRSSRGHSATPGLGEVIFSFHRIFAPAS